MTGKVLAEVEQFKSLGIHTNQVWNIIKGSKDQTGASTLGHDKASITMEQQQRHQFCNKD